VHSINNLPYNQVGWWKPFKQLPEAENQALRKSILRIHQPLILIIRDGRLAVAQDGTMIIGGEKQSEPETMPLVGYAPPLHPRDLGSPEFKAAHNLRYAYIVGAMANGITSVEMVEEAGRAGMIGFFGAAGLMLNEIEAAVDVLQQNMGSYPFGMNLIHSPFNPELESATVDLYLKRRIKLVSASAYLDLSLPLIHFRVKGIHRDTHGNVVCPNKIIAKVSRIEIARKFLAPPPQKHLNALVSQNLITAEEATLSAAIPMADSITAEADSGGHTDNRPAIALLPTMLSLRDEYAKTYNYKDLINVGLAGGIATPESAAAAFAMGAAYVLTGSINQGCVEAGTSDTVRRMLAEADQADVTMAPSADMFELGVKVQVLKRGTMFPLRASKLYDLYTKYKSYEEMPHQQRETLERDFFRCSFLQEWEQTKQFFKDRDPSQIPLAEKNPKHKMALVFRSYLGRSSTWAISGDPSRIIDYQIWCGPAMGAFNQWTKGTFLEKSENRKTVVVAMNLLFGATVATRVNWLRQQGITLPMSVQIFRPMELPRLLELMGGAT
jgi:PfaD family protein